MNEVFDILNKHNVFVKHDFSESEKVVVVTYVDDVNLLPAIPELVDLCQRKGYELTVNAGKMKTSIIVEKGERL